ncbi:LPXTG cell wall anchor domain-containing protein [Aerococcaceae bacterium WS4759]|uniref:LPXTG cell wall anchor domain-containing protein n=1 Tax=Fundicoccus ignavus TaxID=2664442 RepID=A0A6I2H0K1_9LACT|nr:LPXTG cell wall anchor domain-containing protein [Fundicoccus ignavus]MRI86143.1 LPXTG cell wall anchor domain-containing protein [Fundicoccus ignavus]
MKLKKLLFVSASALALGAVNTNAIWLGDALGTTPAIVHAQELTADEATLVAEIKNMVAGLEPVNLEQLLNVKDEDLLLYYSDALETSANSDELYKAIYDELAANYPELSLLRGEQYDAYRRAAEAIAAASSYTFSDLNMALPSATLALYQAEFNANGEDVDATVAAILPEIETAVEEYIERREQREAEAAESAEESSQEAAEESTEDSGSEEVENSEETGEETVEESSEEATSEVPVEESLEEESTEEDSTEVIESSEDVILSDLDKMKASLVEYSFLTEPGLTYFDEATLNTYLPVAVANNFSAESALAIQDMLVSERPDLFIEEQIQGVADKIRAAAVAETPMLQAQAAEIPNAALLSYDKVINTSDNGVEYIFNRSTEDYPEVFADEANRFRTALNESYGLNEEDLAAVPDVTLLWEEYYSYLQAGGAEDLEELAAVMQAKYEVSTDDESSEAESESESESEGEATELDSFKEALVSQTDLTNEQVAALGDETLQSVLDTFGFDVTDLTEGNVNGFRRMLITYYSDNFTDEQVNSVANLLRESSVSATPMTMDIANQIPSGDFLTWSRESIDTGGNDITYPFQRALETYPDLFRDLVIQAKSDLVGSTALTQAQVDQMQFVHLLFANFSAEGEVDYSAAEQYLRDLYPEVFESETSTNESSETSSESESTSVSVSKSTDVESENQETLPNTGETNAWWIGGVAVLLIGVAGYLIYRGRKAN